MALNLQGFVPLIQVYDMRRAIGFYRDILGFEILSQSSQGEVFDWAMLGRGTMRLMVNTAYESEGRPDTPEPQRVAAHKDTALFFDCPDPEAAYEYLRSHDIRAMAPVITGYGMKQVYLSDPDGYELCFQCPAV
jgi:catechol 2,3-dioxygenase-like lactoylglutathione lyase family enzyme